MNVWPTGNLWMLTEFENRVSVVYY
jgi:hypothetical protein